MGYADGNGGKSLGILSRQLGELAADVVAGTLGSGVQPVLVKPAGGTNDTTTVRAAVLAAGPNGYVGFAAGTYVTDGLTADQPGQRWWFAPGVVMKKKASSTVAHLTVTADLSITDCEWDGNRSAGATGGGLIVQAGAKLTVTRVYSHSQKQNAFATSPTGGNGATLIASACWADDIDDGNGTGGSANGFGIDNNTNGYIDELCRATNCGKAGFAWYGMTSGTFDASGYAYRCGFGWDIAGNNARGGHWIAEDCGTYGARLFPGSAGATANVHGQVDTITVRDCGLTNANPSATSLETFGAQDWQIGTVNSYNSLGYGIAITNSAGAVDSTRIAIGVVNINGAGDPGLHLSHGTSKCLIGEANIANCTYAVIFGEGLTPGVPTDNTIGVLNAADCSYGVVRVDRGLRNHVGRGTARDCYTTSGTYTGLIDFSTANATDNYIGYFDVSCTGSKPNYVVHCDANATGNVVAGGNPRTAYSVAPVLDSNGGNTILLQVDAGLRAFLLNGKKVMRESIERYLAGTNLAVLTSGVMHLTAIPVNAGDVITGLAYTSGSTALTMGSNVDGHIWAALYDPTVTLVAQSTDAGGAATWAANANKDFTLAGGPFVAASTGIYYSALMVNSGTGGAPAVPSLRGISVTGSPISLAIVTGQKTLAGTNGAALTTTAPTGPIALTTNTSIPYCAAH